MEPPIPYNRLHQLAIPHYWKWIPHHTGGSPLIYFPRGYSSLTGQVRLSVISQVSMMTSKFGSMGELTGAVRNSGMALVATIRKSSKSFWGWARKNMPSLGRCYTRIKPNTGLRRKGILGTLCTKAVQDQQTGFSTMESTLIPVPPVGR